MGISREIKLIVFANFFSLFPRVAEPRIGKDENE